MNPLSYPGAATTTYRLVRDGIVTSAHRAFDDPSLVDLSGYCASDFHFGPLRQAVVDNRFHRIHHSVEAHHIDKNYGICFSLWDRMFGTTNWPKPEEWPQVGIDEAPPMTVREFLAYPFRWAGWSSQRLRITKYSAAEQGH